MGQQVSFRARVRGCHHRCLLRFTWSASHLFNFANFTKFTKFTLLQEILLLPAVCTDIEVFPWEVSIASRWDHPCAAVTPSRDRATWRPQPLWLLPQDTTSLRLSRIQRGRRLLQIPPSLALTRFTVRDVATSIIFHLQIAARCGMLQIHPLICFTHGMYNCSIEIITT